VRRGGEEGWWWWWWVAVVAGIMPAPLSGCASHRHLLGLRCCPLAGFAVRRALNRRVRPRGSAGAAQVQAGLLNPESEWMRLRCCWVQRPPPPSLASHPTHPNSPNTHASCGLLNPPFIFPAALQAAATARGSGALPPTRATRLPCSMGGGVQLRCEGPGSPACWLASVIPIYALIFLTWLCNDRERQQAWSTFQINGTT
jgi:hypothetical protein